MTTRFPNDRALRLVLGYVPKVDHLPRRLRKLGLSRRTGVVMDSYRAGFEDAFFDADLCLELIELTGSLLLATHAHIRTDRSTNSVDLPLNLDSRSRVRAKLFEGPFDEISFRKSDEIVGVVISEPWVQVGGVEPYRDSYTLAVYSAINLSAGMESEVRMLSETMQVSVRGVVQGLETPDPLSPISRLLIRLGFRELVRFSI